MNNQEMGIVPIFVYSTFENMIVYVFALILAQITSSFGNPKLNLTHLCIPTSSAVGQCHECLCTVDGVYHCRGKPCETVEANETNSDLKECEYYKFYRQDDTICTCNAEGHWVSMECRNKFRRLKTTDNPNLIRFKTDINCSPNEFYLVDCNICKCNPKGFLDFELCTNRACPKIHKGDICTAEQTYRSTEEFCTCSDIHFYIDRLCIKIKDDIIQKLDNNEISNLIDVGKNWKRFGHKFCDNNNTTLTINCNTCICNEKNQLSCSEKECTEKKSVRLGNTGKIAFKSLPVLKHLHDKCIPGVKYRYKCNSCICKDGGQAICSTMLCAEDIIVNKSFLGLMAAKY